MPAQPGEEAGASTRPAIRVPQALDPLTQERRWVTWRWISNGNGRLTKPPFRADCPETMASTTDARTWCDFGTARRAYSDGHAEGIGFVLQGSRFGAFDIDHCRNKETGELHEWARALIERCGSYSEITPSGSGIRIIGTASGAKLHRKLPVSGEVSCELYRSCERYICVTGNQIAPAIEHLKNIDAIIDEVLTELCAAKQEPQKKMIFDADWTSQERVRGPVEGDDHEPRAFSTYSACALATIGELPGTLADRSISVELKRRRADRPGESIRPFRLDRTGHLDQLARQAARWAEDNSGSVAAADPRMPKEVTNRAADNWRPLLAIASVAGSDWPERALKAAKAAAKTSDEGGLLEMLLDDIKAVFPQSADSQSKDEISSAVLVEKLVALEGRPWAEMGKNAKALTQNKLARILKPVAIAPDELGPEDGRFPGYRREQFQEAFDRYLPSTPSERASQPSIRPECDEMGTSQLFKVSSRKPGWTVGTCEKSNNHGLLDGWTVAEGGVEVEGPPERWSGLAPRAVDQLAREVAGLTTDCAAQLEDAIRTRLTNCGVPAEALDVEIEKVVRRINEVAEARRPSDA